MGYISSNIWPIIGSGAAICTMFAFLPQIIKILKNKSAHDVSLTTLIQFSLGVSLWILYGAHLKDIIIITANSITLFSLIILLLLYSRYGRKG